MCVCIYYMCRKYSHSFRCLSLDSICIVCYVKGLNVYVVNCINLFLHSFEVLCIA